MSHLERLLRTSFTALIVALLTSAAHADHPSPLPDVWSNDSWDVRFSDDNPYDCTANPMPGGADRNYLPSAQALAMLRALNGPFPNTLAGDPDDNVSGFAALGFGALDFDGGETEVFVFDCAPGGAHDGSDCDNGSAPADRINMPATRYCTSAADNILRVMGHEGFHHVQFGYIDFGNWLAWGRTAIEGSARMMEDQVFGLLDDGIGVQSFLNEANDYMANPDQSFWGASYEAALGWKYAAEQFGTIATEPEIGTDFIRRFWERAGDDKDNADTPRTFEDTLQEFRPGTTLESWFQDFSIANLARQFDTSGVADASKYVYIDENDGNGTSFNNVALDGSFALPGAADDIRVMLPWASLYYRAQLIDCQPGDIAGFRGVDAGSWFAPFDFGGPLRYAVMALFTDSSTGVQTVQRLIRGAGDDYAVAFIVNGQVRIDELAAVVTSTGNFRTADIEFACGSGSMDIQLPTNNYKAFVGPPGVDRQKLTVFVDVTGPAALSEAVVKGLRREDFSVYVGSNFNAADEGEVLSAVESGARYVLTIYPPDKGDTNTYDLHVNLGPSISATEALSVSYEELIADEIIVLDKSGSMADVTSPEGLAKIESARNAGKALTDRANTAGKIGAVAFDSNAVLLESLDDVTPTQRDDVKMAINGLGTGGQTSIGDGLNLALTEFAAFGLPDQPDWVLLLSDGRENDPLFWANVEASVLADGVHVAAFALGEDADFRLMEEIADKTGGIFVPLDDDPSLGMANLNRFPLPLINEAFAATGSSAATQSNALADAFLLANEAAEGRERLWESRGNVAVAMPASEEIAVLEGGIRNATLTLNWSDPTADVTVALRDPALALVTNATPGVEVFSDDTHVVYHIDTLSTGTWTVEVDAGSGPAEYLGVLAGTDLQAATLRAYLGGGHNEGVSQFLGLRYLWGLPQPITAVLTDKTGVVTGASVRADVAHPDGSVLDLPLFDDGEHGDGDANDGVYGNSYTRTTGAAFFPDTGPEGAYAVAVRATGTNNLAQDFSRVARVAFFVGEPGDPDPDTDGDGMPQRYELLHPCLDPAVADPDRDPDLEGLSNIEEWKAGTDPCNADTDFGGESDASEIERGANPFDPADDALPIPIDPEVVDYRLEHLPFPAGVELLPGTNLIRYPANTLYNRIRLWRSTSPSGPFAMVAEFDATDQGGLYPDGGLVNGTTYYYMVQPTGLSGEVGAYSIMFSGTPLAEPVPPVGSVFIENNAAYVTSSNVTLSLAASTDTNEMMISNAADFAGAVYVPFDPMPAWTLMPDPSGEATVYVRFRDVAMNESPTDYSDDVLVVAPGSLGEVSGNVSLEGGGSLLGTLVSVANAPEISPVLTDANGDFTLPGLPPGIYTLEISRGGYETQTIENVEVKAGTTLALNAVELNLPPPPPADAQVPLPQWALVLLALLMVVAALRLRGFLNGEGRQLGA